SGPFTQVQLDPLFKGEIEVHMRDHPLVKSVKFTPSAGGFVPDLIQIFIHEPQSGTSGVRLTPGLKEAVEALGYSFSKREVPEEGRAIHYIAHGDRTVGDIVTRLHGSSETVRHIDIEHIHARNLVKVLFGAQKLLAAHK
ncbi:hypothetical protein HY571_02880, partial [Candidatus Micrarchaeota archaeon]|nr:hypothetical protein [Candidatus Micrarchaeota archaeon]